MNSTQLKMPQQEFGTFLRVLLSYFKLICVTSWLMSLISLIIVLNSQHMISRWGLINVLLTLKEIK